MSINELFSLFSEYLLNKIIINYLLSFIVIDNHNLQFHLSRPVNYMFKPLISRYRLHAHSLNIETGRYYNIDRHARICNMCNNNDIVKNRKFVNCAYHVLFLIDLLQVLVKALAI